MDAFEQSETPAWEKREKELQLAATADDVVAAQRRYLEAEIKTASTEVERINESAMAKIDPLHGRILQLQDQLIKITPQVEGP